MRENEVPQAQEPKMFRIEIKAGQDATESLIEELVERGAMFDEDFSVLYGPVWEVSGLRCLNPATAQTALDILSRAPKVEGGTG